MDGSLPFENSYARLPERFFARLPPTPVSEPRLLKLNAALAETLRLDTGWLRSEAGVAMLSGNSAPEGAEPLAMAYAGHQFGAWVPQLGDGRAILLGEIVGADGQRRDVQLKGAGRTPFSRQGDGRAGLGPVLREYLMSEAMAALGAPTTRALAAVATGEQVFRERPYPGAILTRVAASHLRVGTFQFFAARSDVDALERLVDYALWRHEPEAAAFLAEAPRADRARALLDGVVRRQAELVAQWLGLGFIHGVMNTDNCAISGETIDYGPCAFMDLYNPGAVFSSIDHGSRYAYGNQPAILQWNLAQLAGALLPLLGTTEEAALAAAQAAVDAYPALFEAAYIRRFRAKLGLTEAGGALEADRQLIVGALSALQKDKADFTLGFRGLPTLGVEGGAPGPHAGGAVLAAWAPDWRARLAQEPDGIDAAYARMRAANPARIPRNHLVNQALAAAEAGDMKPFDRLEASLAAPFEDDLRFDAEHVPPAPEEQVLATYCGT